ncbi:two-component system, chemotaxis family, sensor kinase CheA [Marinomonas polaris DSM 16579]|uniref:Chemotaxis protein CheA n=1 Tax=Marinomonas polaris DSM 16579 TaxID=1122206 RepID=A0A1M5JIR9_9GAMM|nr:chemotaxis protein CheA [Marinomonas polaris]SHG40431.1 two-component system, chemotaxis family, sensor kinase CheA [Marinomonas polaris DSM 16579]|tara:strand:- start:3785 stop:6028 length:2244 start_codon:yes stop_codon:yes gene_type:complete
MSFEVDEEILQDFLVEAGEILEQLSEQLVDLEQNPDDKQLLNAIFRGFHTVKGGAGFLQLTALVDCCHYAENVFDILRNGQRKIDSDLMDIVLQALDAVNEMFDTVRAGGEPERASPELIAALAAYAKPPTAEELAGADDEELDEVEEQDDTDVEETEEVVSIADESVDISDDEFESLLDALGDTSSEDDIEKSSVSAAPRTDDEITEDEFDALLNQLHGSGAPGISDDASAADSSSAKDTPSDEITEDEFEELLDKLHGETPASGKKEDKSKTDTNAAASSAGAESDLITEDEFESLLDSLQSKGGAEKAEAPTAKPEPKAASAKPKPAPKPVPKPAPKAPEPEADSVKEKTANAPVTQEATVRVDTKRLDDIMNMVGELVLVRNRLVRLGLQSEDESMGKAVANLDVVTGDLQNAVMKTRMQPIKKVFGRFPRVVRDLARNMKKEVNLVLRGEETDLDKNLVEALADPLVHLVRNSVDHGVEAPDVREASGKPRMGTVILSAEQEGDHILLSIEDDGAGMDPNLLRRKAVEKGVMDADAADRLSDEEAFNLIFAPGFSTKVEITDVSGRGVGMDVVKTKISQLNGTLQIKSVLGQGSRFIIKVPLTLAIMPTLMVTLSDQAFAFPLVSVNEIFHLNLKKTNVVDGQQVVVIRGKTLPIFHLKNWLIKGNSRDNLPTEAHVVVVQVGMSEVGFVVDQLVGQEEVVIKPLGKMLQGTAGMAGATITGDGRIALILDVPSMLKCYASR